METNTGSIAPQVIETNYTVRVDYVALFVLGFVLGFTLAYKLALAIVANTRLISGNLKKDFTFPEK